MKVSVEKPGSPEEILHFGKKGMKWGQRKAVRQAANAKFNKANPTSKQRTQAIKVARGNQAKLAIDYQTASTGAKKAKLKKTFLNNPDRATSLRLTRGEKVVAAILWTPVTPVGVAVSATIAARTISRRRAQKREARN